MSLKTVRAPLLPSMVKFDVQQHEKLLPPTEYGTVRWLLSVVSLIGCLIDLVGLVYSLSNDSISNTLLRPLATQHLKRPLWRQACERDGLAKFKCTSIVVEMSLCENANGFRWIWRPSVINLSHATSITAASAKIYWKDYGQIQHQMLAPGL